MTSTSMNTARQGSPGETWTLRFTVKERILHALIMSTFIGLAMTGIPLLFSSAPWAQRLGTFFGGYAVTGWLHRLFAAVMIGTFLFHVADVAWRAFAKGEWRRILWGPDSMVPQPKDVVQVFQHMRWFVGLGKRPKFDRFAYWEKFDYWAVFWGMFIIGLSGLMLWFPIFFSKIVPGWMFNIAMVVHGEEALLAMVFIFTVHFFNGNLRPEKFPMDTVMFDGRESLETLQDERPAYYDRLVTTGELEEELSGPPRQAVRRFGYVVGTIVIVAGLVMTAYILYGLFGAAH